MAFTAGMVSVLGERQFRCPPVTCTLIDIALGNPTVGIMVGGSLELLALGWINVGAAMAPNPALASTVSTITVMAPVGDAFSIENVVAAAVGAAVSLTVADQALTVFVRTIAIFFTRRANYFVEQANYRGTAIMHFTALGPRGLCVATPAAVVVALASGDTVKRAPDTISEVITEGPGIAGGFIVTVGYIMVINMMKAHKFTPFFPLGFIFAIFATTVGGSASVSDHSKGIDKWVTGLAPNSATLMALGILGACLVVIYAQLDPEFHDSMRPLAVASSAVSGGSSSNLDDDLNDELD